MNQKHLNPFKHLVRLNNSPFKMFNTVPLSVHKCTRYAVHISGVHLLFSIW